MTQDAQVFPMTQADLDGVVAIEQTLYAHPWTYGNFSDSLQSGCPGYLLCTASQTDLRRIIGYFVLMYGVDEVHLLNLSVAIAYQQRGCGKVLLRYVWLLARQRAAQRLLLEVRRSNQRAQALYQGFGFQEIGVRCGYYPSSNPNQTQREDAVVMQLIL